MFDAARNMLFTLRIANSASALTPSETRGSSVPRACASTHNLLQ
jgi:hypothetical protein